MMRALPLLRVLGVCATLALAGGERATAQTGGAADSAGTPSAADIYEQALVAHNLGEVRSAYIFLKSALQADPFLLPAHLLLGKIFLQLGHGDRAEKELLIAEGLGAHRSLTLVPLARAYLLQDRPEQVIAELFPLGSQAGEDAELLALRGEAYLDLGQPYEARQAFTQALERDPRSVPAILGRIRVQVQEGEIREAASSAASAVELAPRNGQAWYYKGLMARARGDVPTALNDLGRATELLPTLLPAQVARIALLMDLGRMDEAEGAIAETRKIYPNDPRTLYLEALVKAGRGADAEAEAALEGAASLLSQLPRELIERHPPTLLLAGLVSYSLKQWQQANDYLSAYVQLFPKAVGPRVVLGQVALDRHENELAIQALEPALAQAPNDRRVLSLLAEAYMRQDQHLKASQLLQVAIESAGDNALVRAQRAVNRFGLGRQAEALTELGSVFDVRPELADAGATLVVMLLKSRRHEEAIERAIRLVAVNGANLTYINLLGVAALIKGDFDLAQWAFGLALVLEPDFLPAQLNLVELALRRGAPTEARERADEILLAHPGNRPARLLLARSHEAQGQTQEALRVAEGAVEADPAALPAVIYLAELLLKVKDAPKALTLIQGLEARLASLDDVDLLATLSRAYVANGRRSDAQTVLQRAASIAGHDAHSLVTIAELQKEAGDNAGAIWSLETAALADPDHLPARIRLGELQADLGQMDKAATVARRLLTDYPDRPYGHHLMGTIRHKEGDHRAALDSYRSALKRQDSPVLALRVYEAERSVNGDAAALAFLDAWLAGHPGDQLAGLALAAGYQSVRQWEKARALYEQAVAKAPDSVLLLNNLALVYTQLGDPRALDYARRAFQAMPDSPAVGDTLGWVLVRTGQVNEGLKYLRDAQLRAGTDPNIRYHLAYALSELERRDEAIAELEIATAGGAAFAEREEAMDLLTRLRPRPAPPAGKAAKASPGRP